MRAQPPEMLGGANTFTLAGVTAAAAQPAAVLPRRRPRPHRLLRAAHAHGPSRPIADTHPVCQSYAPLRMGSPTRCSAEYRDRDVKNSRLFLVLPCRPFSVVSQVIWCKPLFTEFSVTINHMFHASRLVLLE